VTYQEFRAGGNDAGKRLDRVLRRMLPHVRLGDIFALLRTGRIRINGQKVGGRYRVSEQDVLQVDPRILTGGPGGRTRPHAGRPISQRSTGGDLSKYILLENEHVLCLNKPRGLSVHGPDSVEQWVLSYTADRLPKSLSFRPGPAHRLDRNTSGILFFGLSSTGAQRLATIFREGTAQKIYLAVLSGDLRTPRYWHDRLERDEQKHRTFKSPTGAEARLRVFPVLWNNAVTLVLCQLETGRTHQIRAQAAAHGHPLVGDRKYGGGAGEYVLHAPAFILPEYDPLLGFRCVFAEPPERTRRRLDELFSNISMEAIRESVEQLATEQPEPILTR